MDELLRYLKLRYRQEVVTGYADCNLLLWGDKTKRPINILGLTLVVGVDINTQNNIFSKALNTMYSTNIDFKILYNGGKMIAEKAKLPFLTIAYNKEGIDSSGFYLNNPMKNENYVIDSLSLAEHLNEIFHVNFDTGGTHKDVNKSTADVFHDWSRANLSSSYTKVDIDGIYINNLNNKIKLIEIKRSPTKSVGEWKPYFADASNYEIECELAKRLECEFITLHHCEKGRMVTDNTAISYFSIKDVDYRKGQNDPNWISYENETPKFAKDILTE